MKWFILSLFCFFLVSSELFGQACKTNSVGSVVDADTVHRKVVFETNDLPDCTMIGEVNVRIRWQMVDTDCALAPVFGFNEEAAFRIISPSGTQIDLVQDAYGIILGTTTQPITYNGFNSINVNVVFDDQALVAAQNSGNPASGSFRPHNPLSILNGESPLGTWTLVIGDGSPQFPMCYSEMEVCITCASAAPVEIEGLTLRTYNDKNVLAWTSHFEVNSRGYYIEAFKDEKWEEVAFIESHNRLEKSNYSYSDKWVSGKEAYRLKIEDIDGKYVYSSIVKVHKDIKNQGNNRNVFYADQNIVVALTSGKSNISITDLNGRLIYQNGFNKKGKINLDLVLDRGIYILKNNFYSRKIMVF